MTEAKFWIGFSAVMLIISAIFMTLLFGGFSIAAVWFLAMVIFGVPYIFHRYPDSPVLIFWKKWGFFAFRVLVVIFLIIALRQNFSLAVHSISDSLTEAGRSRLSTVLGTASKGVVFDINFIVVVGSLVILSVFQKTEKKFTVSRLVIGTMFVLFFLGQAGGALCTPESVTQNGYLGSLAGTVKDLSVGFGKPKEQIAHFIGGQFAKHENNTIRIDANDGDEVEYLNPTAPFAVLGTGQWYVINGTTRHKISGSGDISIAGLEEDGYVQIKIIPHG